MWGVTGANAFLVRPQKIGYRPPAWAEVVNKILKTYNTKVSYIRMAAKSDLIKLSLIFEKYNLIFWKILINEMIIVLEKFYIDSIVNSRHKNKNQATLQLRKVGATTICVGH